MHRAADAAAQGTAAAGRRPAASTPSAARLARLLQLAEPAPALPRRASTFSQYQDAVDHVAGKVMSALGFAQDLFPPRDGAGADASGQAPRRFGDLPIDRDPSRIEAMFGGIAARYDLMNRLMTVGLDGRWRRMAAAEARLAAGEQALDACCGTGDLSFSLAESCRGCDVTGLDFTPAMLVRARQKADGRERRGLPVPREFVAGDLLESAVRGRSLRRRHRRVGRAQRAGRPARLSRDGPRDAAGRACRVPRVHASTGRPGQALPRRLDGPRRAGARPDRHRRPVRLRVPAGVGGGVPARRRTCRHHGRRRSHWRPLSAPWLRRRGASRR